ncbi:MAG TPA: patatin-like phospholipase family protein, partial [Hyphomicrobiaceae bacterium]|jgi:NTE family protein|nr:patatin-like phospholipase family protein [Hyphomicrobiaceae bacterium]
VREKLKAEQPDIYIDVEVDEFHVLQFYRFKAVLEAAMPAKEKLRRQLLRVLASQTAETLPANALPEPARATGSKRLPRLKRLAPGRRT